MKKKKNGVAHAVTRKGVGGIPSLLFQSKHKFKSTPPMGMVSLKAPTLTASDLTEDSHKVPRQVVTEEEEVSSLSQAAAPAKKLFDKRVEQLQPPSDAKPVARAVHPQHHTLELPGVTLQAPNPVVTSKVAVQQEEKPSVPPPPPPVDPPPTRKKLSLETVKALLRVSKKDKTKKTKQVESSKSVSNEDASKTEAASKKDEHSTASKPDTVSKPESVPSVYTSSRQDPGEEPLEPTTTVPEGEEESVAKSKSTMDPDPIVTRLSKTNTRDSTHDHHHSIDPPDTEDDAVTTLRQDPNATSPVVVSSTGRQDRDPASSLIASSRMDRILAQSASRFRQSSRDMEHEIQVLKESSSKKRDEVDGSTKKKKGSSLRSMLQKVQRNKVPSSIDTSKEYKAPPVAVVETTKTSSSQERQFVPDLLTKSSDSNDVIPAPREKINKKKKTKKSTKSSKTTISVDDNVVLAPKLAVLDEVSKKSLKATKPSSKTRNDTVSSMAVNDVTPAVLDAAALMAALESSLPKPLTESPRKINDKVKKKKSKKSKKKSSSKKAVVPATPVSPGQQENRPTTEEVHMAALPPQEIVTQEDPLVSDLDQSLRRHFPVRNVEASESATVSTLAAESASDDEDDEVDRYMVQEVPETKSGWNVEESPDDAVEVLLNEPVPEEEEPVQDTLWNQIFFPERTVPAPKQSASKALVSKKKTIMVDCKTTSSVKPPPLRLDTAERAAALQTPRVSNATKEAKDDTSKDDDWETVDSRTLGGQSKSEVEEEVEETASLAASKGDRYSVYGEEVMVEEAEGKMNEPAIEITADGYFDQSLESPASEVPGTLVAREAMDRPLLQPLPPLLKTLPSDSSVGELIAAEEGEGKEVTSTIPIEEVPLTIKKSVEAPVTSEISNDRELVLETIAGSDKTNTGSSGNSKDLSTTKPNLSMIQSMTSGEQLAPIPAFMAAHRSELPPRLHYTSASFLASASVDHRQIQQDPSGISGGRSSAYRTATSRSQSTIQLSSDSTDSSSRLVFHLPNDQIDERSLPGFPKSKVASADGLRNALWSEGDDESRQYPLIQPRISLQSKETDGVIELIDTTSTGLSRSSCEPHQTVPLLSIPVKALNVTDERSRDQVESEESAQRQSMPLWLQAAAKVVNEAISPVADSKPGVQDRYATASVKSSTKRATPQGPDRSTTVVSPAICNLDDIEAMVTPTVDNSSDPAAPLSFQKLLSFGQIMESLSPVSRKEVKDKISELPPEAKRALADSVDEAASRYLSASTDSVSTPEEDIIDLTNIETVEDLGSDKAEWLFDVNADRRPRDHVQDQSPGPLEGILQFASSRLQSMVSDVQGDEEAKDQVDTKESDRYVSLEAIQQSDRYTTCTSYTSDALDTEVEAKTVFSLSDTYDTAKVPQDEPSRAVVQTDDGCLYKMCEEAEAYTCGAAEKPQRSKPDIIAEPDKVEAVFDPDHTQAKPDILDAVFEGAESMLCGKAPTPKLLVQSTKSKCNEIDDVEKQRLVEVGSNSVQQESSTEQQESLPSTAMTGEERESTGSSLDFFKGASEQHREFLVKVGSVASPTPRIPESFHGMPIRKHQSAAAKKTIISQAHEKPRTIMKPTGPSPEVFDKQMHNRFRRAQAHSVGEESDSSSVAGSSRRRGPKPEDYQRKPRRKVVSDTDSSSGVVDPIIGPSESMSIARSTNEHEMVSRSSRSCRTGESKASSMAASIVEVASVTPVVQSSATTVVESTDMTISGEDVVTMAGRVSEVVQGVEVTGVAEPASVTVSSTHVEASTLVDEESHISQPSKPTPSSIMEEQSHHSQRSHSYFSADHGKEVIYVSETHSQEIPSALVDPASGGHVIPADDSNLVEQQFSSYSGTRDRSASDCQSVEKSFGEELNTDPQAERKSVKQFSSNLASTEQPSITAPESQSDDQRISKDPSVEDETGGLVEHAIISKSMTLNAVDRVPLEASAEPLQTSASDSHLSTPPTRAWIGVSERSVTHSEATPLASGNTSRSIALMNDLKESREIVFTALGAAAGLPKKPSVVKSDIAITSDHLIEQGDSTAPESPSRALVLFDEAKQTENSLLSTSPLEVIGENVESLESNEEIVEAVDVSQSKGMNPSCSEEKDAEDQAVGDALVVVKAHEVSTDEAAPLPTAGRGLDPVGLDKYEIKLVEGQIMKSTDEISAPSLHNANPLQSSLPDAEQGTTALMDLTSTVESSSRESLEKCLANKSLPQMPTQSAELGTEIVTPSFVLSSSMKEGVENNKIVIAAKQSSPGDAIITNIQDLDISTVPRHLLLAKQMNRANELKRLQTESIKSTPANDEESKPSETALALSSQSGFGLPWSLFGCGGNTVAETKQIDQLELPSDPTGEAVEERSVTRHSKENEKAGPTGSVSTVSSQPTGAVADPDVPASPRDPVPGHVAVANSKATDAEPSIGRYGSMSGDSPLPGPPGRAGTSVTSTMADPPGSNQPRSREPMQQCLLTHFEGDPSLEETDEGSSLLLALTRSENELSPSSWQDGFFESNSDVAIALPKDSVAAAALARRAWLQANKDGMKPSSGEIQNGDSRQHMRTALEKLRLNRAGGPATSVEPADVDELFSRYDDIVKHMNVLDDDRMKKARNSPQLIDVTGDEPVERSRRSIEEYRSQYEQMLAGSTSAEESTDTTQSQKARNLRAQLDEALKTSKEIRSSQERLGAELTTFKSRLHNQRQGDSPIRSSPSPAQRPAISPASQQAWSVRDRLQRHRRSMEKSFRINKNSFASGSPQSGQSSGKLFSSSGSPSSNSRPFSIDSPTSKQSEVTSQSRRARVRASSPFGRSRSQQPPVINLVDDDDDNTDRIAQEREARLTDESSASTTSSKQRQSSPSPRNAILKRHAHVMRSRTPPRVQQQQPDEDLFDNMDESSNEEAELLSAVQSTDIVDLQVKQQQLESILQGLHRNQSQSSGSGADAGHFDIFG